MDGFTIRLATRDDADSVARLHVKTFIETHGGFDPPRFELRQSQWSKILAGPPEVEFTFVAEVADGSIVGFVRGVPYSHEDQPDYDGCINKIYVLKSHHRRGIGRSLLSHAAREFLARGIGSALLFGDANNPSNGFYEHLEAERLCSAEGEFHGGYGWRDLSVLLPRDSASS